MERVLELALERCQAAEVFRITEVSTPVEFENNRLKRVETSEASGLALRVIKDGKVGFSSTTKAHDEESLVDNAIAVAEFGAPATFEFPGPDGYAAAENYDPAVLDIPVGALVQEGTSMVELLRPLHPALMAGVSVEKAYEESEILNSSGLHISQKRTAYYMFASAEVVEGENFLSVYDGAGSSHAALDLQPVKRRLIEKVKLGQRNAPFRSGSYPVIMSPYAVQSLMLPLMACINGRAVQRGFSPLKDKIGQQVATPRLNLYDDPLRPRSLSTSIFDGEGLPRRRLPVVERGELKNFHLDLKAAAALRMKPTGSATRDSIERPPSMGPSNLVIEPGAVQLEQMIRGIDQGLLVDVLMGAWSGNPYGGAVNGNVMLGFVIDKGELVGRCKNAMLSANVFQALSSQLQELSSERIDYGNSVFPYMLLDGIGITVRE
ncbi:MAG: TldD/PmbA family protein [Bacillota bacterium]|nr:TldD/PmbA family protein [Bacillota bacterium]